MKPRRRLWRCCLVLLLMGAVDSGSASEPLSFNRDIRPILSEHCFACHGFDQKQRQADLRLDTLEGATADLGGRQAIQPGSLDASELWQRVASEDEDTIMPPADFHRPLSSEQKRTLQRWIEAGAPYESHWSFIAPTKPALPTHHAAGGPIDAFILQRLSDVGMQPAEQADAHTLIRRVTIDLTGLPPTPAEVDAFLADTSPDAYERLVDRLLQRPSYGEQMARLWLDLARYADTHGLHLDNERAMWPYRDWVVRALNENLPFDEFTRWQLAGDLLPNATRDQLIASGFNRCNVTTSEGGSINEEWVYRYAVDRTSTAVEVWMGLTAGCAVCHDHKFDPLSTKEFYSLYAFFHSAADPAMDGNKPDTPPILKLISPGDEQRLRALDANIASIDEQIDTAVASLEYTDPATIDPPPAATTIEEVWFEDQFPATAQPKAMGAPLRIVTRDDGEVFSGEAALSRTADQAVAQDSFAGGASFAMPKDGTLFVHCFLDPQNPPQAIMVQFHVDGWKHRAVWGDEEKIPFGDPGTHQKVPMGDLPEAGRWVRLEIPAADLGMQGGPTVTGYAFTQFGGSVTWDRLGVASRVDTSRDPAWSWQVWKQNNQGKRNNDLPDGLRELVRGKKPDQWSAEETSTLHRYWLRNFYAGSRDLLKPLESLKAKPLAEKAAIEKNVPLTLVMADLPQRRESFVMLRGQYDNPGERVEAGVPSFLPPLPPKPADRDYNRLDLANWLVSGTHPLTARVTVNRLWQHFFGTGLVATSEDFGSQGEPASHPELLDWLANQFVEDDWDVKRLIKRIVTSGTYRQHSGATPEAIERDPDNRLLARGPRLRLDAEVLRDQALFVSGLLVPAMGGSG
ncbi:MAG: PSD1 and planctomycete cytochrome C domain-containing protein, partial [Planctomycetaceae bacterium]